MKLLIVWFLLTAWTVQCQTPGNKKIPSSLTKYVGKYETNGMVVQVVFHNGALALVVPGAPLQEMVPIEKHRFKSGSYDDAFFDFIEKEGAIEQMVSDNGGNSIALRKISNAADKLNQADSLLTLKTRSEHFVFLCSEIDSTTIAHIASQLEANYNRILKDFNLDQLPPTTVRVYPNKQSFHQGINFPGAPDALLATAFGKDDVRMASPRGVDAEDSIMLIKMVTHEFTHCVHLNIDYSPNNPRWLWEGVANFEAGWFIDPGEQPAIRDKIFPPFATLTNGLEYDLGYVIIEAIRDIWGFDKVIELIKKRGNTIVALGVDQKAFEETVYQQIYRKYIRQ